MAGLDTSLKLITEGFASFLNRDPSYDPIEDPTTNTNQRKPAKERSSASTQEPASESATANEPAIESPKTAIHVPTEALAKDPALESAKESSPESAQASSEEPTKESPPEPVKESSQASSQDPWYVRPLTSLQESSQVITEKITQQPPENFKQQPVTTLLQSAPEQPSEPNARTLAQEPSPEPAKRSVPEGTPGSEQPAAESLTHFIPKFTPEPANEPNLESTIPSQTGPTDEPAPQRPEQSTSGLVKEPAQEPAGKPIQDSLIDPELLKLSTGQPAATPTQEPAQKSLPEPTKETIQGPGSEPAYLNAQTIHPDTPKSNPEEHPAKDSNQEPVSESAQPKAQPISPEASKSTPEECLLVGTRTPLQETPQPELKELYPASVQAFSQETSPHKRKLEAILEAKDQASTQEFRRNKFESPSQASTQALAQEAPPTKSAPSPQSDTRLSHPEVSKSDLENLSHYINQESITEDSQTKPEFPVFDFEVSYHDALQSKPELAPSSADSQMTGQEAANNVEALLQASIHTSPQEAPQQGLGSLYPASVQDFSHEAEQPKVEAPSTIEIPFEKAIEAKAEAPTQDSTHQTLQLPLRPKAETPSQDSPHVEAETSSQEPSGAIPQPSLLSDTQASSQDTLQTKSEVPSGVPSHQTLQQQLQPTSLDPTQEPTQEPTQKDTEAPIEEHSQLPLQQIPQTDVPKASQEHAETNTEAASNETSPFKMVVTPPSSPVNGRSINEPMDSAPSVTESPSIDKSVVDRKDQKDTSAPQPATEQKNTTPPQPVTPMSTQSTFKEDVSSTPRTSVSGGSQKGGVAAKALQNRPTQEQSAFDSFKSLCAAHGLLKRPAGLREGDVVDGINDDATLL